MMNVKTVMNETKQTYYKGIAYVPLIVDYKVKRIKILQLAN